MHIQIYSKQNCPYCTRALRLAEKVDSNYEEHTYDKYMLDTDFTREQLLEKFPTARTFPQITIDGISIGGYEEFNKVCGYLDD
jgi:glutaredoxin